jgi:stage III sporulation protein AF
MISFLSEWLKEIILLILLATFIDLLLPNSSMQRYVKLVIGLFVLMTILNPIFTFLHSDWKQIERFSLSSLIDAKAKEMKSLTSVEADAMVIRREQEESIRKAAQSEIEAQIRQQVERDFPYTVDSVKAQLKYENDEWMVSSIEVQLLKETSTGANAFPRKPIGPVQRIQPVVVHIGNENGSNALPIWKTEDAPEGEMNDDLRQALSKTWDVPTKQINIIFAVEVNEGRANP